MDCHLSQARFNLGWNWCYSRTLAPHHATLCRQRVLGNSAIPNSHAITFLGLVLAKHASSAELACWQAQCDALLCTSPSSLFTRAKLGANSCEGLRAKIAGPKLNLFTPLRACFARVLACFALLAKHCLQSVACKACELVRSKCEASAKQNLCLRSTQCKFLCEATLAEFARAKGSKKVAWGCAKQPFARLALCKGTRAKQARCQARHARANPFYANSCTATLGLLDTVQSNALHAWHCAK